ncbi:hypothetical protein A2U01_0032931, partial [Trifolium medium]|nr:hypothetical protein [Trifolium medium]
ASPIQLAGRQIYIEERRPSSGGAARGGRAMCASHVCAVALALLVVDFWLFLLRH